MVRPLSDLSNLSVREVKLLTGPREEAGLAEAGRLALA